MQKFRVAAFQRHPLFDDISGTTQRLMEDLAWCDREHVDLAVFPECYLQGYASDTDTVSRRALVLQGDDFQGFAKALADFRTDLIVGLAERRPGAGGAGVEFYNTAVVMRSGRLLGRYAKAHPNEAAFAAGKDFPVFDRAGWRYGINICNDANFADVALEISHQGASLLCYPLNNMLLPATAQQWRSKSLQNLQQRALDTGCWVVSSDVTGETVGKMSYGCTCIVSPNGTLVKQVPEGEEGVVMLDIALDA
ncbi:carbon-nitrogen hydrolase family protein [Undibacterium sp. TJN25]|uniref:carbon-nitrogen hydrolase family protein n=1 Tax=Undibacterium sp. TJN25 TaxID=3413056 RepID=UPI003BF312A0